jgi:hypothetical protein
MKKCRGFLTRDIVLVGNGQIRLFEEDKNWKQGIKGRNGAGEFYTTRME